MELNSYIRKICKKIFLISLLFPITLWSCDKIQNEPVEFEFQLLDEEGEQSTEFSYEENFTFSFSIINNTEERLTISEMYNMDNFFEVFKIGDSGDTISFGKPYDAVFCEFVGGYLIKPMDTFLIEIPWIPDPDLGIPILCNLKDDNNPIPVGNYQTSVSPTFTFQKGGEDFLKTPSSINISFKITP